MAAVVFLFFKSTGTVDSNPWEALPDSPSLILELDDPMSVMTTINKKSIYKNFSRIKQFKIINDRILNILNLLENNDANHKLINGKNTFLIAVYREKTEGTIYVLSTSKVLNLKSLNTFLKNNISKETGVKIIDNNGEQIIETENFKTKEKFFLSAVDKLILISKNKTLISDALKTYNDILNSNFATEKSFAKIRKAAGKSVKIKLFYKGKTLKESVGNLVNEKFKPDLLSLQSVSKWTEADILFEDNELILNGMSVGDSTKTLYRKLLQQNPRNIELLTILPFNTNMFVFQGFSDFKKWYGNEKKSCKTADVNKFAELVSNETAVVNTSVSPSKYLDKSFVVIKVKDIEEAKAFLDKYRVKNISKTFNGHKIKKLPQGDFTRKLLGNLYGSVTKNYYTFVEDYLVLSNNEAELSLLLMYYDTGKTLDLSNRFKTFSANFTESSNVTVFVKSNKWLDVITRYLNDETKKEFVKQKKVLKNFEGVSIQISSVPPYIYTNLYIKYSENNEKQQENLSLWNVKLDDEIIRKPYPVKDHTTGNYNFIVFDKSSNVYLIRTDGTVLWKKELDGLPESDVREVDYYKNGKIQYLFNTAGKIYLIDRKGRFVSGYPVKISPSASNGLVVFDYNKKKNYRILIAQSDKRIYNYTVKGSKVKGWNKFKMPDIVIRPVQRLVANNKDYIIAVDMSKNIKIVNRRGRERIKIKGKFNIADNSVFYVNRTNSKGVLLTTDEHGKLVYVTTSGKLNYTDFGNFSKNHFFLYNDFNGDGSKDFIYIDNNKLQVFDRFKKVLFSYKFAHPVTIKPEFFNIGRNNKVLGVVIEQEKTIYLFDKKGNIIISNGLVGEIPFTVVNSKNNREINLITGAGNVLYNYRIK